MGHDGLFLCRLHIATKGEHAHDIPFIVTGTKRPHREMV